MSLFSRVVCTSFLTCLFILPATAGPVQRKARLGEAGKTVAPTITVAVDATEAPRKIFHSKLTIPATPGTLTLYYPKWIPGEHAPSGPVDDLAGLKFTAGDRPLNWRRDLLDVWTIHVEVPAGVTSVEANLDYLSPTAASGFSAGSSATATLTIVSWNQVLLYPKGWTADQIQFTASLRLPQGWKMGTALPILRRDGENIQFQTVSLYTLVDSPVLAGEYLKVVPLAPQGQNPPHEMDIAADSAAALDPPEEVWQQYRNLITQAYALFGARHYRSYHFLYTLSDHVAHFGLEHHESSDDRTGERSLIEPDILRASGYLLPHEMVHSWNGKFRRPAGLISGGKDGGYDVPMKGDLLWVYEGLTNYLGEILAPRSGLWSPEDYRESLAATAASLDTESGRTWRPLEDTAIAAQILYGTGDD